MLYLLLSVFLLINAETSWYAAYNLSPSQIQTLTKTDCYRGNYGSDALLSLFTCPLPSAQHFSVLPENTFLCVIELNDVSYVQTAVDLLKNNNDTHDLLFVGTKEIIIASKTNQPERPDLCDKLHFVGVADNVRFVPNSPIIPQREPPVDHPAYIKTILKKNMVPDPYIEFLLTQYRRQSVIDQLEALSTGRDGTNTKITRNSYSIALGRAGCVDASWKCANHATQYIVDTLNEVFSDYPYDWSVTTNSFRADMCHNVILDITGTVEPEKWVLTGAHLDSRNPNSGPTATGIAPGADDNGTGSSVQLEFAMLIARYQVRTTFSLRVMWFCGEEQGLIGSNVLARAYATEGLDVQGMFNMDMIGYTYAPAGVTLSFMTRAATPWLSASCKEISTTYFPALQVGDTAGCCSDQQSFFNAGFPAAGIFETPTNSVVYPEYHRVGDQWNNGLVNHQQVFEFGRSVSACILEYAIPIPTTPFAEKN